MALSTEDAGRLLSAGFGRPVRALSVAPAQGGMVSSVWMVTFDAPPGRAVL